ncbi:hypothetical protein OBBRIDRAFT_197179 [Obba rivulosa]|uniref:Uncharacterized protein n=1 Tax=Obba rivulosa TaxID=1052685 RepID=A0A8E2J3Y4_9APHY|nr:hypothetical protein OBBRIDRAFT_197179 [Obba rivulosa]
MQPGQGRSRRPNGTDANDNEASSSMLIPRADVESRSEAFPHSHRYPHRSESYRTSPPRGGFDMRREGSSSRARRDVDEWRPAEPPHPSHDPYNNYVPRDHYHRGGRVDYEPRDERDVDSWVPRSGSALPSRQWEGYDQNYPATSYQEPSSWTPPRYDNRKEGFGSWPAEEGRSGDGRSRPRYGPDDRQVEEWPREDRRNSGTQEWRRDSGWDRPVSDLKPKDDPLREWRSREEPSERPPEDRSWEPAPNWQANRRNGHQGQRNQNPNRNNQQQKGGKGGKKNNANKQKRDWRNDDGQLNNWTRREPNAALNKNDKTMGKRKQRRSPSPARLRSRSPAESFYSRRSSRGRSRSPDTPKRRRRDFSRGPERSISPSDRYRGRNGRQPARYSRSPASSPRSYDSADPRGRPRRRSRSLSTSTSRSPSRSPSQSPKERARTVHRLPPATSIRDLAISYQKSLNTMPPPARRGDGRKGRAEHKERRNDPPPAHPLRPLLRLTYSLL